MTEFDQRWQALVASARRAPAQHAPLSDLHAARLAGMGLAAAARQRESELAWRGMAVAASLFLTCVIGFGVAVQAFVPRDTMREALAMSRPELPDTIFIPAPPRLPELATLASAAPQWSPARVLDRVSDWLVHTVPSSAQENAP